MRLKDLLEGGAAGVRGFAASATLGLVKYPQAVLYSQVMGVPYEQALHEVRASEAAVREANPTAYTIGSGVGTIANAAVPGAAVTSIPRLMARGAIQGGVTGFTANEGMDNALEDTLTGATIGAAAGGVGAGLGKFSDKARRIMGKDPEVQAVKLKKLTERAQATAAKMGKDPVFVRAAGKAQQDGVPLRDVINLASSPKNPLGVAKSTQRAAKSLQGFEGSLKSTQNLMNAGNWKATGYSLIPKAKETLVEGIKGAVRPGIEAGLYGAGGYALGSALGAEDPMSLALIAAGLRGGQGALDRLGTTKAKAGAEVLTGLFSPKYGEVAARAVTPMVTRSVVERAPQMPAATVGPAAAPVEELPQTDLAPWERTWDQPAEASAPDTSPDAAAAAAPAAPARTKPAADDVPPWERRW